MVETTVNGTTRKQSARGLATDSQHGSTGMFPQKHSRTPFLQAGVNSSLALSVQWLHRSRSSMGEWTEILAFEFLINYILSQVELI